MSLSFSAAIVQISAETTFGRSLINTYTHNILWVALAVAHSTVVLLISIDIFTKIH
jgi:hypothetical protein